MDIREMDVCMASGFGIHVVFLMFILVVYYTSAYYYDL